MTAADRIAEVVAAADFGTASARKTGRNLQWPYVPVVKTPWTLSGQTQVLARAFATRDEAVADAQRHIDQLRASLAEKLAKPNYRALRAQYGIED